MSETDTTAMDGSAPSGELELDAEACAALDRLYEVAERGSHYEILGVGREAGRKEIQAAFYDLSRQWHPDRFFRKNLGEYEERVESVFIAISDAYRVLSDDARRATYDLALGSPSAEGVAVPRPPRSGPGDARARRLQREKAEARTRAAEPATKRPRARPRGSRMDVSYADLRAKMVEQLRRARRCYEEGKVHFDNGNFVKASASLHLATVYDPDNEEYAALNRKVVIEARRVQARALVAQAESAESFQNFREAMATYKKAIEYGPDHAVAHFRLGMLVRKLEEDTRSALSYLREAVRLDPKKAEFRIALGDLYVELGLKLNARREYQAILEVNKNHEGAKEGLKRAR